MRTIGAVLLGVLVLFTAAFAAGYTLRALSVTNRGLAGPAYTTIILAAGLAGQVLAGYAAARVAGRTPYAHAIAVGAIVVGLVYSPSLLQVAPDWWAPQAANIDLRLLPGLLAGAWIASRRGT